MMRESAVGMAAKRMTNCDRETEMKEMGAILDKFGQKGQWI